MWSLGDHGVDHRGEGHVIDTIKAPALGFLMALADQQRSGGLAHPGRPGDRKPSPRRGGGGRVAREDDSGLPGKGMRVRGFRYGVGRQPAEAFPVVGVLLLEGECFELLAGEPLRLDRGVVDELAPGGQGVGGRGSRWLSPPEGRYGGHDDADQLVRSQSPRTGRRRPGRAWVLLQRQGSEAEAEPDPGRSAARRWLAWRPGPRPDLTGRS